MSKTTKFITIILGLTLIAQWFMLSRLREENKKLLQSQHETEQIRSDLDQALEKAANYHKTARALALEVKGLQEKLEHVEETLASTAPTNSTPLAVVPPITTRTLVLTTNNIDPASIHIISDSTLIVKLSDTTPEDLERLHNEISEVIVGEVVATGRPPFAQVKHHGTNTAIVLVLPTRKQAEKIAAILRGKDGP